MRTGEEGALGQGHHCEGVCVVVAFCSFNTVLDKLTNYFNI